MNKVEETIPERQMDYVVIDWKFLEENLTPEIYREFQADYRRTSSTLLTNYTLGVILKRWIREYPILKQATKFRGLYSALINQEEMEMEVLESLTCKRQRAMGITDMEMLEERGDRPVQGSEISHQRLVLKQDFNNDSEVILTGAKDKYNKNIEAIKVLKTLEDENRFATHSEQVILNYYTGWGGIPQVFDL